jgi:hypothetical protein
LPVAASSAAAWSWPVVTNITPSTMIGLHSIVLPTSPVFHVHASCRRFTLDLLI